MKQKDLLMIIVIVAVSAAFSLAISKALIVSPKSRQQQAEVVQAITSDFPQPDHRFFNSEAFDPTQLITIGQSANPDPFSSTKH